ncbi:hypothetical protein [Paenibacillus ferrarius]|uniref:hypothetical protein n=1 Tax=Paenibacillus ferrarius TaxID=1469647 RepID=UPI003D2E3FB1
MIAQVAATDGSLQTYTVTNASGVTQPGTQALATNVYNLVVKAEDGTTTASYKVYVGALAANAFIQPKFSGHTDVFAVYNAEQSIIARTGITAANLLAQLESVDATHQTYSVIDAVYSTGFLTGNANVYSGDQVKVTAQDGTTSLTYTIKLVDVIYDIDPVGTYTLSASPPTSRSTATDDIAGKYVRNGAMSGTHLQYTFAKDQYIQFAVTVPSDGNYEVLFGFKKNTGRATFETSVDGTNLAAVNELLVNSEVQGMYSSTLGTVSLTAGSHVIKFAVPTTTGTASFDFIAFLKK